MDLLNLPNEVLLKILENLSYTEIGMVRAVSQRFNEVGQLAINHGFHKTLHIFSVKCKRFEMEVPRREPHLCIQYLKRRDRLVNHVKAHFNNLKTDCILFMESYEHCTLPGGVIDDLYRDLAVLTNLYAKIQLGQVDILPKLMASREIISFD